MKKKIITAIAAVLVVAVAVVSGGIAYAYGPEQAPAAPQVQNTGAAPAEPAAEPTAEPTAAPQPEQAAFHCDLPGCTLVGEHQHGLCGVSGCTLVGQHSHGESHGGHHSGHGGGHH